tara:strand:+ start:2014 stop:3216 length:1203 start_codon:yes stop_codon:yes gene_type:complete
MPEIIEIEEKLKNLEWGGNGPLALITLLSNRRSWREDKLEEAYYREVGPNFRASGSNFRKIIIEFLRFGLIKETKKQTGYRFSLNRNIWEIDTRLFKAINIISKRFNDPQYEERIRNGTKLKTYIKKIRSILNNSNDFSDYTHQKITPIAATISYKIRDFSDDQSVPSFVFSKRTPDELRQRTEARQPAVPRMPAAPSPRPIQPDSEPQTLFSVNAEETILETTVASQNPPDTNENTADPIQPEFGPSHDQPDGLPRGCQRILNPTEFWPQVIDKARTDGFPHAELYGDRSAIVINRQTKLTRSQKVFISLFRKKGNNFFLFLSLCGLASDNISVNAILKNIPIDQNDLTVRILTVENEDFVCVTKIAPFSLENSLYDLITPVSNYADNLEKEFWGVDEY